MDAAFRAVAEPRRRAILRLVADDELSSGEIAAHFEVSGPAISQHLRVLESAGLVAVRRDGRRRLYRARPEGLAQLRSLVDAIWASGLTDLQLAAEAEEQREHPTD